MGEGEFRFVFGEPPEELKEQMKAEFDRQQMLTTSMQHDIARLFREQTLDNLRTMRILLHLIAASPLASAFYEGCVAMMLEERWNVCACGSDHDEDLAEVLGDEAEPETEADRMEQFNDELAADRLKLYGLEYHDGKLYCSNCAKEYPSIEDRALREPGPEGCPGCVERAKWG